MEITGRRYTGRDWRAILGTRRGTLLVALACGAVAAAIIVFALHRYRQSVTNGGQPETVLVATQLIPKGTTGEAIASGNWFRPQQILAKQVTTGAIFDTAAIKGKVTIAEIYPGQQLTAADFATSGDLTTQLAPGERALSVPLLEGAGLVGQLQAGDHVDIYATYSVINAQGRDVPITKLLVPDVTVLEPATPPSGGFGTANLSTQTSDVVLKVNAADAEKLAFTTAQTQTANTGVVGVIWLALRSANATPTPDATQLLTIDSILFGSKAIPAGLGG